MIERELEDVLDLLLRSQAARDHLTAGRWVELGVAAGDRAVVAAIDPVALAEAAAVCRSEAIGRDHRGSGSLLDRFPATIAGWLRAHPGDADLDQLAGAFLGSPAYAGHRTSSRGGAGLCLEEAFFRFCDAEVIGDPVVREREYLSAAIRALACSPRPDFTLPAGITEIAGGFVAIAARGAPHLHAVCAGRVVEGPVSTTLAERIRRDPGSLRCLLAPGETERSGRGPRGHAPVQ